jgi:hypothetical protein
LRRQPSGKAERGAKERLTEAETSAGVRGETISQASRIAQSCKCKEKDRDLKRVGSSRKRQAGPLAIETLERQGSHVRDMISVMDHRSEVQ